MTPYTAIVGGRDNPRDDILCFTDHDRFIRPVMNAKIYKILPFLFIDDDTSVWVDGNIKIKSLEEVEGWLDGYDMALFRHPERKCVYDEGMAAIGIYRDDKIHTQIFDQMDAYKSDGYPKRNGLWECGVLVRRHNEAVKNLCLDWWAQICRWSNRDQISFPYVLSRHPEVRVKTIDCNMRNHPNIEYKNHIIEQRS